MINRIMAEKALEKINSQTPSGIKVFCILKCYPETPVFSDGGAVVIIFGERAFLFGTPLEWEEMLVFLRFNSVKSLEGETEALKGEKKELSVMEAEGENKAEKQEKIEPAARLIASVFGLDFSFLYSDLCRRVNLSRASVFGNELSAAALHKGEGVDLLWGVSVKESDRGKGRGLEIVKRALETASGKVLAVCEKEKEGFYKKCGFKKTGSVFEINVEEISS